MKVSKAEREEHIEWVREHLPPGTRVYALVTHVSRSGMSRRIRLLYVDPVDHELSEVTYRASRIVGWPQDDRGMRVDGCGMDMGFHAVYTLSSIVHRFTEDPGDHAGYKLKHERL